MSENEEEKIVIVLVWGSSVTLSGDDGGEIACFRLKNDDLAKIFAERIRSLLTEFYDPKDVIVKVI
jgi:Zn-dependent membrane protease YugP